MDIQHTAVSQSAQIALCSGLGKYATDKKNTLQPVTLNEIEALLLFPTGVNKDAAQWVIFSDLMSREHAKQREQGRFYALWADFDEQEGLTLQKTAEKTAFVIPDRFHVYASRSATEANQKARVIVPLAEPISGADFVRLQRIFNDKLEAQGLKPDRVTERAGQVCYLPNKGEFYGYVTVEHTGQGFNPSRSWCVELEAIKQQEEATNQAAEARKVEAIERNRQRAASGTLSPIKAFNEATDLEYLMQRYGYQKIGSRWLPPESTSGSAGVTVKGDRWISSHGCDSDKGADGSGDAFDLFCYYEQGGNRNAALKDAGAMFTTTDGLNLTQANQQNYMQQQAQAETVKGFNWLDNPQPAKPEQEQDDPKPLDLSQFQAARLLEKQPPPQRYVIEGLIPEPIAAAIVAPGGTGKSFWLMQLAACVASGSPFMGCKVGQPGGVLMLAAEDDADELSRRLHTIVNQSEWYEEAPAQRKKVGENFYPISRLADDNRITIKGADGSITTNHALVSQIVSTAKLVPNLRLIILDPVSRFRTGEENASEDNTRFVEALEFIRRETGVTVLVAHHAKKGSTGETQDDIRGSSAFVDALRWAATLTVLSPDAAKKVGISEDDRKSTVRFTTVKSNYRVDAGEAWFRRGVGGYMKQIDAPVKDTKTDDKGEERYLAALPKLKDLIRKADAKGEPLTERALREYAGTGGIFGMGEISLRGVIKRALEESEIYKKEEGGLALY